MSRYMRSRHQTGSAGSSIAEIVEGASSAARSARSSASRPWMRSGVSGGPISTICPSSSATVGWTSDSWHSSNSRVPG